MAADGQIVFEVTADTSNVITSMREVTKNIEKESKKWDSETRKNTDALADNAKNAANAMDAAFTGACVSIAASLVTLGTTFLAELGKWVAASISVASTLEEVQNVVDATFGDTGSQAIESWAKRAGKQFGMTELQAKKFAATIGTVMKASGITGREAAELSTEIAGLAADFASLYDVDVDKAVKTLTDGLSGSADALKKTFGIDLSNSSMQEYFSAIGGEGKFTGLSQTEQMLLRYQKLLQETAEVQGNFARTADDSLEGIQKQTRVLVDNLQADVGKGALPFWKQLNLEFYNFLKLLTGDNGVRITGTENQLNQWLNEQAAAAEQARANLDELADTYGAITGWEREDFESEPNAFYKTYGEFVLATLRTQQQGAAGRRREQIDAALAAMEGEAAKITEAEAKVADFQKQLDQLAANAPDTTSVGAEMVSDLADGMESSKSLLQAEVDSINAILAGIGGGSFAGSFNIPGLTVDGSHASGLDYVPFDGYLAKLHEGETILSRQEAMLWRSANYGSGVTSEVLDAILGSNLQGVKAGGNVYLDGRTVGQVISDQQGKAYRQLQRSGWQQ